MIPNMRDGLFGFTKRRTTNLVTKVIVDHQVISMPVDKKIRINVQPMPAEVVNRKPEYQRSWKWYNIYADSSLKLKIDDIIVADKMYKICEISDWSTAGIMNYEAVEDFESIIPATT